jgi:FkbH-like protein
MIVNRHTAILISDFTISNLAGYLSNEPNLPEIDAVAAPFGQVMQVITDDSAACWQASPDVGVVWTLPDRSIQGFTRAIQCEPADMNQILQEVDAYCAALLRLDDRLKWVFVPTWVLPSHRGLGVLDLRSTSGLAHILMQMNARLVHNLQESTRCIVLDAQRWLSKVGEKAFNPKLWYLAKIAFSNEVLKEAARDIKTAIRALNGQTKKLIILDLDETLWGGIVGDLGWENLVLGGHDPVGEAFVDFQKQLKALKNRGILLAVVSKNEESIALEAIRKHPEMVLREDDLAGWRINWQDKAENIAALVSELNVGLDSAVFIDDNPVERSRIRQALPDVAVPEWPQDKLLYTQALLSLDHFDADAISTEDRDRTAMYTAERQRASAKTAVASTEEWLHTLETRITVEPVNAENIGRVVQLFNKTNQMNLSTRRMSASELAEWSSQANHRVFAFRVSDRFGDSGLTGILSTQTEQRTLRIVDFILSCRVMGRNVEDALISFAVDYGRARNLDELRLQYVATAKNKPCLDFLLKSKLAQGDPSLFSWLLAEPYPSPGHITLDSGPILKEENRQFPSLLFA